MRIRILIRTLIHTRTRTRRPRRRISRPRSSRNALRSRLCRRSDQGANPAAAQALPVAWPRAPHAPLLVSPASAGRAARPRPKGETPRARARALVKGRTKPSQRRRASDGGESSRRSIGMLVLPHHPRPRPLLLLSMRLASMLVRWTRPKRAAPLVPGVPRALARPRRLSVRVVVLLAGCRRAAVPLRRRLLARLQTPPCAS